MALLPRLPPRLLTKTRSSLSNKVFGESKQATVTVVSEDGTATNVYTVTLGVEAAKDATVKYVLKANVNGQVETYEGTWTGNAGTYSGQEFATIRSTYFPTFVTPAANLTVVTNYSTVTAVAGETVTLTYVVNVAEPKDMAKYLTYSATLHSVFGAFGYLIGGVVGEFSIRATFLLQAATLFVCGIMFRLCCVADAERTEKVSIKELAAKSNPFDSFRDGKYFMNTAFVLLFLVNILINLGNTCFDQVFNYYLKDQLGLTSAYNGIIKAVVGFISFLFNMTLCLWIIRKADTGKSTVVLVAVCTLASLGTVFAPQISVFLSCGIALYAGYSVSVPVLQDMVATRADPAQKNLVMGFYNATKSLGSIIGSLLAGFLYAIHVKLPFVLIAVVYALSVAAAAGYLVYCRVGEQVKC